MLKQQDRVTSSQDEGKVRPEFRPVGIEEFCKLALSRRNLVRCDDTGAAVRSLLDPDAGIIYSVEESELLRYTGVAGTHS